MKKFLLIAVAAFGMLMTACSKDEVAQPVGGEESIVTFTVEAPVMATRAHGDGYSATELNWAVYDRNADEGSEPLFTDSKNFDQDQLTTTVKIPFVNGMTYDVLFWAEAPGTESPYAVDWAAKTVGYADATKLVSNSEDYDAFYYFLTGNELPEITGPVTKTVELKRPFAQLNIKTNDADKAEQSDVVVKNVKVVVKNGYSSFDLAAGEGETNGEVAFGFAPKQGDETLAVNYLFTGGEKSLVDVEFTYTDEAGKLGTNGLTKEYATVPVQRNYRTNIIGSLLTSEGVFEVEIKKDFATEEHNVEIVTVASATELVDEITNGDADQIILTGDINLNDLLSRAADKNLAIPAGRTVTLDLGGHTLSAVSTQTGKNYDMIDVRGTLTVANGTITTKHEGQNMAWNYSTNVFNVTAGGVLNLESVVAKNLGGSDMAYVAHLNNWGEVTLNVNNSTLESPYVAVRVFNSGYDMNNVTIKNSTLKAKNCVWVHNYTAADFGTQDKADAQKALLNFDILNGTNTFEYTAAAVRLGMTNSTYLIDNAVGLKYVAEQVNSGASYYKGSTIKLIADIDLNNEEWTPIGSFAQEHGFMGNFDGNGKVIKNLKISNISLDADNYAYAGLFGLTEGVDANNENYIKNLVIENVNISTEGHIVAAAIAYPYYTNIENVLVKGNVTIKGGNYTSGVLAYTRRCVNAKDIAIAANEGSSIEGDQAIGGVISDIQMNGGLKANYSNFAASGLTIKGNKCVGGISGIICLQTLNGATVKNVTIVCDDARRGIIAGADGGKSTVTNISYENVTGATRIIGATYDKGYYVGQITEVDGIKAIVYSIEDGVKAVSVEELNLNGKNWYNAMEWAAGIGEGWALASIDELDAIHAVRVALNDALEADDAANVLFEEGDDTEDRYLSSTEAVGVDPLGSEYFPNRVHMKLFNVRGYWDAPLSTVTTIHKSAPLKSFHKARAVIAL